ncbi:hypothetical protein [Corallococcus sp. EGB]|uniref:hypothetical protein n=1 Tax=Corallococcus sp. EGB TaxID=1521117 RepID=UPI001CBF1F79|nr:hypothetical protein [Corallococcus sp. EGB]
MCEAAPWSRRGALRPRLRLPLALAVVLAPLLHAEAFPISPWTLRELTQSSELVVWADVEAVTWAPPPTSSEKEAGLDGFDDGQIARLRIREVWRGTAARPDEQLEVHFNGSLICPAPARYEPGLAVVAFLERRDGRWRTLALSYGTRYPESEDELAAYRRAVQRFRLAEEQAIVARAAGREAGVTAARTDWLVYVAAHPATRWDGLYGLASASDEALSAYDFKRPRLAPLSTLHREQLAQAFVTAPSLDRTLPMMLTVLRGHESTEVDRMAARALESILAEKKAPPHWVRSAFDLLRERYGEKPLPRPEQPGDPLLRAFGGTPDDPSLRPQWQQFKQRHHLTPKRLPMPWGPAVPGTGANTTP